MPKPGEERNGAERAGLASGRRRAVLSAASHAGLLAGESGRIGARVRKTLVQAAKAQTGIASDTELLEYALATVALEDHFAETLLALEGSVPRDLDLEF
jgi:hypothetical protein